MTSSQQTPPGRPQPGDGQPSVSRIALRSAGVGEGRTIRRALPAGRGIVHAEDSLHGESGLHAARLWIALPPTQADCEQPIVMWWNFVGFDPAYIAQAKGECDAGSPRFGRVEGDAGRRLVAPKLPWSRTRAMPAMRVT